MQSEPNKFRSRATERLFLAVVNQAISDFLENEKEAKDAERWLLSKDFDVLDRLFAFPAKTGRIAIATKPRGSVLGAKDRTQAATTEMNAASMNFSSLE